MTKEQKAEITKISKQFAGGFKKTIGGINGSGWLIVDPLSGYLNAMGFENTLQQLPATIKHPQILIMRFKDGTAFIPAGGDLKKVDPRSKNWLWIGTDLPKE